MEDCCAPTRDGLITLSVEPSRFRAPAAPTERDMALVPGGDFEIGADDEVGFPDDGEGPIRTVRLKPFSVDRCAVTNAQFEAFVASTGYQTEAERFGWSFVFHAFVSEATAPTVIGDNAAVPWWRAVPEASWRHPEGPDSDIAARADHPVVHVSWNDALAYCQWAGTRLPTEAEWESAARGGLSRKRYPWGDELLDDNAKWRCNIWQGDFPVRNTLDDGFFGTAPARSFDPNGYGIYQMSGNVWEWCADWFSVDHEASGATNPVGPSSGSSRVIRGGSYLCHDSYCNRYRVAARSSNTPDSSCGNLGFRCVRD